VLIKRWAILKNKLFKNAKYYYNLGKKLVSFIKQCLCNKKIIIISDREIFSLPVNSKFQIVIVAAILFIMLWVSYSTGKYFTYESVISRKDREIWSTSVTNEKLQYQVTDLHQNLKELNKYFDTINTYNHDMISGEQLSEIDNEDNIEKKSDNILEGKQRTIYNIRNKIAESISSIGAIIKTASLNIYDIAINNPDLRDSVIDIEKPGGKGGPFIPATIKVPQNNQ